jgi:SAM-dependent methyltransferase
MNAPPSLVARLHFDARNASNEAAILHSALRLGLLDAVHKAGSEGVEQQELARRLEASPRGINTMVEMLLGMGLCRREHMSRVHPTPALSGPLQRPEVRSELEEATRWFAPLAHLADAVRGGKDEHRVLERYRRIFLQPPPAFDAEALSLWERFAVSGLRTQALLTAKSLGLFDVAAQPVGLEEAARKLSVSLEGLRVLKAVLERMGLLAPGEVLRYTEEALPLFGEQKNRAYMVRSLEVSGRYWEALSRLDETIRKEKVFLDLKDPATSAEFYADNSSQITAVFASHFRLGRQVAATVATALKASSILDIGTGSGVWGAAFATTFPQAQVSYFDQTAVLPKVRVNLEQLKLLDRARLLSGDLFTHDFGEALYDVIVLPQVLNVLLPQQVPSLIQRAARALKPTGILTIAEYVLTDQRDGPLDHLYFHFRRLITNEGDLLSFPEYRALLEQVGLTQARCFPLPTQEVILASRPGVSLPETLAPPPASPRKS